MKIYAPVNSTQASCRGIMFIVEDDGSIDVAPDIAQELLSCGFTTDAPAAPLTPKQQKNADREAAADKQKLNAAVATEQAAATKLFNLEGRGDVEAVVAAKADLDAAQVALKPMLDARTVM